MRKTIEEPGKDLQQTLNASIWPQFLISIISTTSNTVENTALW